MPKGWWQYPQSLQDVIEEDVIGPGYHSLVKQPQYRLDNVKRSSILKMRKRKQPTENKPDDDTDEISPEQRAAMQHTYGCVKWDAKYMPRRDSRKPT